MKITKENSAKIIEALGGATALADKLGINKHTIASWKLRGIPAKIQLEHSQLMKRGISKAMGI